jgi:cysteine desulfurase
MRMERHYFDWAATALPAPSTAAEIADDAGVPFANPSSRHVEGRAAKAALENARSRAAAVLGVNPGQVYFTSGGSESNTIVLHAVFLKTLRGGGKGGILCSAVEHPSVRENCALLQKLGVPLTLIGVEADGRVTQATLEKALAQDPAPRLVSVMAVNNETGACNDIAALSRILREREGRPIHVHSDMVQALGKVPLDLAGVDSASFAAHKLGGPRGVGILYLRKPLEPLAIGGGQEGGVRAGTENLRGALAFTRVLEHYAAAGLIAGYHEAARARMRRLIERLHSRAGCTLIPASRTADDPRFSPYILQAAFDGLPGETLARSLDDAGFAISTGSACHSKDARRPVLAAMGVDEKTAFEGVRISQGWTTRDEEIALLGDALLRVMEI